MLYYATHSACNYPRFPSCCSRTATDTDVTVPGCVAPAAEITNYTGGGELAFRDTKAFKIQVSLFLGIL